MAHPNSLTIVRRSLRYFHKSHIAVGMGVAAATAVIVGALVVGESVRGSLKGLVLNRLANVESIMQSRSYFNQETLTNLGEHEGTQVVPAILLSNTTVERQQDQSTTRASKVQMLAVNSEFWDALIDPTTENQIPLEEDEVAVNQSLANELALSIGDEITIRMSDTPAVPADNPLGRRDSTGVGLPRQKIVSILPDSGIGGLSLLVGQSVNRNIFCNLATVQDILESNKKANAAIVFSDHASSSVEPDSQELCDDLNLQFSPSLEDYGLQLTHHQRTFPDESIDEISEGDENAATSNAVVLYDYYQLTSIQLILDQPTVDAVTKRVGRDRLTRLMTYLANGITKVKPVAADLAPSRSATTYIAAIAARENRNGGDPNARSVGETLNGEVPKLAPMTVQLGLPGGGSGATGRQREGRTVPYSIVAGIDFGSHLALDRYRAIELDNLQAPFCYINSWLAEQLDASPGDWLELNYFEPETVDGQEVEKRTAFMIAGVVPLTEPKTPYQRRRNAIYEDSPTVFNDPDLTPTVPGVTDQASISNWDTPFELDADLLLDADDTYWNNHRLTPKVFMLYQTAASPGRFGSRFGQTTSIRFERSKNDSDEQLRTEIEEALLETKYRQGLAFRPIRNQQLTAATGSTPFDQLFLALSFFVIVAAILLVSLLLKLSVERRVDQIGLFIAQGFTSERVRGLLLREFSVVAGMGSLAGVGVGLLYARAMVAGLQTWWLGAISTPFLSFQFQWPSLVIGFVAGFLCSILAIYVGLRRLSKSTPLSLLRGDISQATARSGQTHKVTLTIAGFALFGACGLAAVGIGQTGMTRAGIFFGSGMLLLTGILLAVRQWIELGMRTPQRQMHGGLFTLAWRAISRNPVRSSLALGLLSVASFLIASMGIFHISPSETGYGGFNLIGESSRPIFRNIASPTVRTEMIGDDAKKLLGTTIIPMRVKAGEDASCNNLYQVAVPTILGVPTQLEQLTDLAPDNMRFSWSAAKFKANPWVSLKSLATGEDRSPIPVILDQNTAAWSLKKGASLRSTFDLTINDRSIRFKTVGLLSNSVLQGKLLIGTANFERLFPDISGASYFLIHTNDSSSPDEVTQIFESGWGNEGMDISSSRELLVKLLGVQNTYISAFQTLGALGLLLGTFGLVAVQLRSIVERRKELALMQAVGFSTQRIANMLTLETGMLLGLGMLIGLLSAAVALAPFIVETGSKISWIGPLLMLLAVLGIGFLAALLAVQRAARQRILEGLHSE